MEVPDCCQPIVVLDPSLALPRWGPLIAQRMKHGSYGRWPHLAPSLCSRIRGENGSLESAAWLEIVSELGLEPREVELSLESWKKATEEGRQMFIDITKGMSDSQSAHPGLVNCLPAYDRCLTTLWPKATPGGPFLVRIFAEQISLAYALSLQGVTIVARMQSDPWVWRLIQATKWVPFVKHESDETAGHLVKEKWEWLRQNGIGEFAFVGVAFGFAKFVFHDTSLGETAIIEGLRAGKVILFDP